MIPPHPSASGPQFAPAPAHVIAVLHGPPSVLNAPVEPALPAAPTLPVLVPPPTPLVLCVLEVELLPPVSSLLPHEAATTVMAMDVANPLKTQDLPIRR